MSPKALRIFLTFMVAADVVLGSVPVVTGSIKTMTLVQGVAFYTFIIVFFAACLLVLDDARLKTP